MMLSLREWNILQFSLQFIFRSCGNSIPCNFEDAVFPFGNGTFTFSGCSFRCHFHGYFLPFVHLFLVATVFLAILRMLFFPSGMEHLPFLAAVFVAIFMMLFSSLCTFISCGNSIPCSFEDAVVSLREWNIYLF